ncbi:MULTISPECIES: hypothetical protein [Bradyrhizobium]|nr:MULTISPECIES: hypothetical protein [unclassified Bradyrhizobium]
MANRAPLEADGEISAAFVANTCDKRAMGSQGLNPSYGVTHPATDHMT